MPNLPVYSGAYRELFSESEEIYAFERYDDKGHKLITVANFTDKPVKLPDEFKSKHKIILSSELKHLPAPRITLYEDNMKVTLYASLDFNDILQEDKLWACYLHACIRYVEEKHMTNTSLRERFGLDDSYKSQMSRLIKQAVESKLIKPFDPTTAPRYMRYIPIWA